MYAVTDAYNEAMELTVRNKSWIKIQFGIVDPDATAAATLTNNGALSYDNTQGTVVGATSPATYATLEQNRWILDGKNPIPVTDNPNYQGYVGNLISGLNCTWSTNPQIIVVFDDYFRFAALTFMFDQSMNEYPSLFQVQAYHDDELVQDITETPTGYYWTYPHQVSICNKLVLTWLKSALPYRRARMTSLIFGLGQSITQNEMESCTATKNFDIQSTAFPKNNFDLTLIDTTKSYDPENPNGVWEYLESRQPIDVSIGYSLDNNDSTIEWIPWIHAYTSGDFSVSGSDAYTLVTIKGVGLIEHLTMTYNSSKYYPNGRSLYDMAYDVINASGYSNVIEVDQSLRNIITRVPLPSGQSNDLLQLIANAACSVMNHNRGGVLQIYPESSVGVDFNMDFSKMTSTPQTAKTPPLRYLTTKYHPVSVENEVTSAVNEQEVEVAGGGGVYAITNLIPNGNFETDTSGWTAVSSTLTKDSSYYMFGSSALKIVATGTTYSRARLSLNSIIQDKSHVYYLFAYGIATTLTTGNTWFMEITRRINDVTTYDSSWFPRHNTTGIWERANKYFEAYYFNSSTNHFLDIMSANAGVAGTDTIFADGVCLVDLTAAFGAGNEPTKAWCDEHLSYFEGTIYISKNSYVATNLVKNGGMEKDENVWIYENITAGYAYYRQDGYVKSGKRALELNVTVRPNENNASIVRQDIVKPIAGHKYYGRIWYFPYAFQDNWNVVNNGHLEFDLIKDTAEKDFAAISGEALYVQNSMWNRFSGIITAESTTGNGLRLFTFAKIGLILDEWLLIDLTETFGAGKEPTKEWCDEHIPFFEGTTVLDDSAVEITFNHDAYINQTLTTNGALYVGQPEFFVYKTVVPLLGKGTVTITGNKLNFGDIEYTKKFGDVGEDLNTMDNELIDNYNMCVTYADWLAECVQRRNSYKSSDRGYPQLDVGDNITISTNFNTNVPVTITEQSIKYNGAISGNQAYIIMDGDEQ